MVFCFCGPSRFLQIPFILCIGGAAVSVCLHMLLFKFQASRHTSYCLAFFPICWRSPAWERLGRRKVSGSFRAVLFLTAGTQLAITEMDQCVTLPLPVFQEVGQSNGEKLDSRPKIWASKLLLAQCFPLHSNLVKEIPPSLWRGQALAVLKERSI